MDEKNDKNSAEKRQILKKNIIIVKKIHLISLFILLVLIFVAIIGFSSVISFKNYLGCDKNKSFAVQKTLDGNKTTKIEVNGTNTSNIIKINYRLPLDMRPYLYELTVLTDFNEFVEPVDFNGTVIIHMKCMKTTDKIILHVKELEIFNKTIKLVKSTTQEVLIKSLSVDYEREFFIVELYEQLQIEGNYTLFIQYRGFIKEDNIGLYRSSYIDNQGKQRYYITLLY